MTRGCVAVVLVFACACSRDAQDTPESVLGAWVSAMNASRNELSSRHHAFDLLSSRARASLTERAARASQLSGRDLPAWEMLAPGRFAMRFAYDPDLLTTTIQGDRATVTARGRQGEAADVPLIREEGHWRVDLELPAIEPIRADSDARVP